MAEDPCQDLWYARNLIFDRAGFCFDSTLGKAIFDNSDCTTRTPEFSPEDSLRLARIEAIEDRGACAVNTATTLLDLPDLPLRKRIDPPPVLDPQVPGWGCVGWTGGAGTLHIGQSPNTLISGQVQAGDTITSRYLPEQGWSFLTVERPSTGQRFVGWSKLEVPDTLCESRLD
ncbi:DUF4453 domain-containing protein [Tropicimonas sp. IMCC34043]|uniref:DUF4453 domain-containing protein n=1 Tax=Tropicimonas sp. IMCC34043 TaxID=2248760 RepID=UPI0018E55594|nr:DUF4453 domain-containing protein [Tropicimonas sp. IMCC34043]